MNYLKAHEIVNKYIEVVANKESSIPFLKKNDFSFSQEELILAFKLHLAIIHRYGKKFYSQEEVNEINNLLKLIVVTPWVDNQFADEYVGCLKILNDTSWLGKMKNRTAIPFVKDKIDRLKVELLPSGQAVIDWLNEIEQYNKNLEEIVNQSVALAKNLPSEATERKKRNFEIVTKYCLDVYDLLNLDVTEEDVRLFWPLPVLYQFINQPSQDRFYTLDQKRYITNNRQG